MYIRKIFFFLLLCLFQTQFLFAQVPVNKFDKKPLKYAQTEPVQIWGLFGLAVIGAGVGALVGILYWQYENSESDDPHNDAEGPTSDEYARTGALIGAGAGILLGLAAMNESKRSKGMIEFSSDKKAKIKLPTLKYNTRNRGFSIHLIKFVF